jgi:hypothetical protein
VILVFGAILAGPGAIAGAIIGGVADLKASSTTENEAQENRYRKEESK